MNPDPEILDAIIRVKDNLERSAIRIAKALERIAEALEQKQDSKPAKECE